MFEASRNDVASLELIRSVAKPCPNCSRAIELAGGCPHIYCPGCGVDFCWKCGCSQLTGTFVRTCPQCNDGYIVHSYIPLWVVLWVVLLPLWLLYTSLASVFWLIALPCKRRCDCREDMTGVFLPFVAMGDILLHVGGCIGD